MADVAQLPHIAHHVHHVAAALPIVTQGYSMFTLMITHVITAAIAGGLGYYIKARGMAGVNIDIANIKTDVLNLKNKIDPSAPAPISAA